MLCADIRIGGIALASDIARSQATAKGREAGSSTSRAAAQLALIDEAQVRGDGDGCRLAVAGDHAYPHTRATQRGDGGHDTLAWWVMQSQ